MNFETQPTVYLIFDKETGEFVVNRPRGQAGHNTQKRCGWTTPGGAKRAWAVAHPHGHVNTKPGAFDKQDRYEIMVVSSIALNEKRET